MGVLGTGKQSDRARKGKNSEVAGQMWPGKLDKGGGLSVDGHPNRAGQHRRRNGFLQGESTFHKTHRVSD